MIPSTIQRLITGDARHMASVADQSIDLVVTSPPYPMIAMWDTSFANADPDIATALKAGNGRDAFERMHAILGDVWKEVDRAVKAEGGIVCINIGDATRSLGGDFRMYSNHSRIIQDFEALGFSNLPNIIWRKPTNAPSKFMGSGTYPPSAYVTLEHEFILLFRKGAKRTFDESESDMRRHSAYFWEERNTWFSDLWDIRGITQQLTYGERHRSAAFPLDIPFRLVQMFSIMGDAVLDPFAGTATTLRATSISARNGIAVEMDAALVRQAKKDLPHFLKTDGNTLQQRRFDRHMDFVSNAHHLPYQNQYFGVPVKSRQEQALVLPAIHAIRESDVGLDIDYRPLRAHLAKMRDP